MLEVKNGIIDTSKIRSALEKVQQKAKEFDKALAELEEAEIIFSTNVHEQDSAVQE